MTLDEAIKGKKAALIDMDGVLYDSMPRHCKAWRATMLEEGLDIPEDEFYLYEGMTGPATINLLMERCKGVTLSLDECKAIYARKAEKFQALCAESGLGATGIDPRSVPEPMPGAADLIRKFHDAGLLTVLVTGSAQGSLLGRLDTDYPGAFPPERRVTALDVTHGKPHPEPYLRGLEKAGAMPGEAVVLENAPLGVRAGKGAGILTIAWTTGPIPREAFEAENADLIMPRDWRRGQP